MIHKRKTLVDGIRVSRDKAELAAEKLKFTREFYKLQKEKERLLIEIEELKGSKINIAKRLEFYSQSIAGMINTSLEKDKSVFTMSVAGIGYILAQLDSDLGMALNFIYVTSALSFLICIVDSISIFKFNKDYIIETLKKDNAKGTPDENIFNERKNIISGKLKALDSRQSIAFIAAVFAAAVASIAKLLH